VTVFPARRSPVDGEIATEMKLGGGSIPKPGNEVTAPRQIGSVSSARQLQLLRPAN